MAVQSADEVRAASRASATTGNTLITTGPVAAPLDIRRDRESMVFPPLAGPASFLNDVVGAEPVTLALNVLDVLSPDSYLDFVRNFYKAGLANIGPTWVYADINTVLMGLARRLAAENYLEIGVRRGRSMAMVASQVPDCRIVGFDLWVDDYAGMENPDLHTCVKSSSAWVMRAVSSLSTATQRLPFRRTSPHTRMNTST